MPGVGFVDDAQLRVAVAQRSQTCGFAFERDAGNVPGPVLHQVQAQTTGRSYLEDLPAVYRRDDSPTRFLERWLAWTYDERPVSGMPGRVWAPPYLPVAIRKDSRGRP